jgi:hypothetical protein
MVCWTHPCGGSRLLCLYIPESPGGRSRWMVSQFWFRTSACRRLSDITRAKSTKTTKTNKIQNNDKTKRVEQDASSLIIIFSQVRRLASRWKVWFAVRILVVEAAWCAYIDGWPHSFGSTTEGCLTSQITNKPEYICVVRVFVFVLLFTLMYIVLHSRPTQLVHDSSVFEYCAHPSVAENLCMPHPLWWGIT